MAQDLSADIDAELPIGPSKAAQLLLYMIAGLVVTALVWASAARLDRVTRGEGRVVPSNHLQTVQYLEGGIIEEILVKAGDEVEKGQVLVRVDPTQINAQLKQGAGGYHLLLARIVRLEAELRETKPAFPPELAEAAPEIVAGEQKLYAARKQELDAGLALEQGKLGEARAALDFAAETDRLARQELGLIAPLVEKGLEPRIELIRTKQRAAAAEIDRKRAEFAAKAAENEISRIKKSYFAGVADELAKAKAELASSSGDLPALKDKMSRTEVRAPIDGVVNRVLVATVGGVVQPGQTIVEIVPVGDTPLIEAKIKQSDIGFLSIGQKARVKITAYDSSVYGSLEGVIETISPDAIEDEKNGQRHFLIMVRTKEAALKAGDGALPIMPGMAAEVDVLNGKRTVLAYILNPITDIGGNALREN